MDTISYLPVPDQETLEAMSLGTAVLCYGWHDPSVVAACARTANLVVAGGQTLEMSEPEEAHHYRAVRKYLEMKRAMPPVVFSCADALELTRMWPADAFGLAVVDTWQMDDPLPQLVRYACDVARRFVVVDRGEGHDIPAVVRAQCPHRSTQVVQCGLLWCVSAGPRPVPAGQVV